MATTLGVATTTYAPWAVFCYGGPVFSLLIAAASGRTGFGVNRLDDDGTAGGAAAAMVSGAAATAGVLTR